MAKRLTHILGKILSEVLKDRDDVVDQFLSGLRKMGIESSVPHVHKEIGTVVGNGFPRDPTDYGFPMGLIKITYGPIRWISIRRYIVGQKWGERGRTHPLCAGCGHPVEKALPSRFLRTKKGVSGSRTGIRILD